MGNSINDLSSALSKQRSGRVLLMVLINRTFDSANIRLYI